MRDQGIGRGPKDAPQRGGVPPTAPYGSMKGWLTPRTRGCTPKVAAAAARCLAYPANAGGAGHSVHRTPEPPGRTHATVFVDFQRQDSRNAKGAWRSHHRATHEADLQKVRPTDASPFAPVQAGERNRLRCVGLRLGTSNFPSQGPRKRGEIMPEVEMTDQELDNVIRGDFATPIPRRT